MECMVGKYGGAVFFGILIGVLALCTGAQLSVSPRSPTDCSDGAPKHASLDNSSDPILRKLSEYEAVCNGEIGNTMMFFSAMPTNRDEAIAFAHDTALRLKAFAAQHITPLVSFEPNATLPNVISDTNSGMYDDITTTYFQTLKSLGITDSEMGTWILFPEANTPTWHNTNPATFVTNVVRLAGLLKHAFPETHRTILLNGRTYESDDANWDNGELKSLAPYVSDMPKGTVDSFGYQGFPSVSPANAASSYSQLHASDFLPSSLARDAANQLHVKDIWCNTGTFGRIYTDDAAQQVTISADIRKQTLTEVMGQLQQLQTDGFAVSLNLFANDKSNEDEHTDWSYWPTGNYADSPNVEVFKLFTARLQENHIHVSLYDTTEG